MNRLLSVAVFGLAVVGWCSTALVYADTVVTPKPIAVPDLPTMAVEFATMNGLADTGTCTKVPIPGATYVQCQAEVLPTPPLPTKDTPVSCPVMPWFPILYRVACQTDIGCWLLGPGEPPTGGR